MFLLFPQGKPVTFALGRTVRDFQLPTVNKLGLAGVVDVFVRISSVLALALSAAKNAVLLFRRFSLTSMLLPVKRASARHNHIIP